MRVFKIKCPEFDSPAIIRKSDWKDRNWQIYTAPVQKWSAAICLFLTRRSHTLSAQRVDRQQAGEIPD